MNKTPIDVIKLLPIIRPVLALLSSRKGVATIAIVLATFGLDLAPNVQAAIVTIMGAVLACAIAYEDGQEKRAGVSHAISTWGADVDLPDFELTTTTGVTELPDDNPAAPE